MCAVCYEGYLVDNMSEINDSGYGGSPRGKFRN